MKSPLPEEKLLRRLMRTSLLTNDTKRKDVGRWGHFLILMEREGRMESQIEGGCNHSNHWSFFPFLA